MRYLLSFCAAVLLSTVFVAAQAPVFSQFYAHRPSLNPAYVSAMRGLELTAGYRRQWGQVQDGLQTAYAAAAVRTCRLPLGWGVYVSDVREPFFNYREQEAGIQAGGFLGSPERWSLHGGLQAGLGQHRVDFARLLFSGQLDPIFGVQGLPAPYFQQDGSRVQTFEVGMGAVLRSSLRWRNSEWPFSIGAALHHFGGSREVSFLLLDESRAPRMTAHGALTLPVSGEFDRRAVLYLNALGRLEWESGLQRGTVGLIAQYDAAHFGLLYQFNRQPFAGGHTQALTLTIGADFPLADGAQCTLQYGFDGVLGGLGQAASGGGHELAATFTFDKACLFKGKTERGRTDCFHFAGKGYRGFY